MTRSLSEARLGTIRIGVLILTGILSGCGTGMTRVPAPRPIVVHSGERLRVERDRMQEVNDWFTREMQNIIEDPTFLVSTPSVPGEPYPWDGLQISGDTVTIPAPRMSPDAARVFQIYGHLHLMAVMGRQDEWLPEAPDAVGFDLEKAILSRAADAWLLGRTVWGTSPYGPLDELAYAKEAGFLDAMIFTARPDEFGVTRAAWARESPGESERYRDWFFDTFGREPPGLRAG